MDAIAGARREVALELRELAKDFERSDGAALSRDRTVCRVAVAAVAPNLSIAGGDWRYPGSFWAAIAGLAWGSLTRSPAAASIDGSAASRLSRPDGWAGNRRVRGMIRIMTRLQRAVRTRRR